MKELGDVRSAISGWLGVPSQLQRNKAGTMPHICVGASNEDEVRSKSVLKQGSQPVVCQVGYLSACR
jgi:hypothetical protein